MLRKNVSLDGKTIQAFLSTVHSFDVTTEALQPGVENWKTNAAKPRCCTHSHRVSSSQTSAVQFLPFIRARGGFLGADRSQDVRWQDK